MVRKTHLDHKKDDSQDHGSLNAQQSETTKTLGWEEIQKKTLVKWDSRGMKINNVSNVELRFGIHIIAHKIYSSSRLNSVPCEAIDLAYKVVKKNLEFDLSDLLLK